MSDTKDEYGNCSRYELINHLIIRDAEIAAWKSWKLKIDKMENKKPVTKKTWDEFRSIGLLWWINAILHTFGWAIVVEVEDGVIKGAYPARVTYRGWDAKSQAEEFRKVSAYLKENIEEIKKEADE